MLFSFFIVMRYMILFKVYQKERKIMILV